MYGRYSVKLFLRYPKPHQRFVLGGPLLLENPFFVFRFPLPPPLLFRLSRECLGFGDFFFSNMSERAGKMLKEDMEVMGPVRLRDVDESQSLMVDTAKDLAAKGEIMIVKNKGDDELIY